MNSLRVSIVTYNNAETIKRCLDSVFAQKGDFELAVSVVDNDSSDETVAEVRAAYPQVELIETGKNLGFGAGHNKVLQNCTETFSLILNPDAWLLEDALARLLEVLSEDEQVGLVGPRMEYEDGRPQLSFGNFPGLVTDLRQRYYQRDVRGSKPGALQKIKQKLESSFRPDWVSGSCFLVRSDAFKEIGCFDENYFLYFEDVDLCRRLREKGWEILVKPGAVCRHLEGHSESTAANRKKHFRRSRLIYENKFGSRIGFFLYKLIRARDVELNWDSSLRQNKSK